MIALPTELPGVAALSVANGPRLLIKPGTYRYGLRLRPIAPNEPPM